MERSSWRSNTALAGANFLTKFEKEHVESSGGSDSRAGEQTDVTDGMLSQGKTIEPK
jgi:hypothetical protein